jgi:hypothetical protein
MELVAAWIMGADIRPRPAVVKMLDVIPGWSEGPDPESRDSGLALKARPGMTRARQIVGFHGAGITR